MNHDTDDILIHPRKGRNDAPLPAEALLVVNPVEARFALAEFSRNGAEQRPLYNSNLLVEPHGRFCLAGPGLGAPAAVLVMEKLVVLGVTDFCLISCCGSIDPELSIGDILVATSGVSGEGVSRYYGGGQVSACGARATARLRGFLRESGTDWREGVVWSTDAPFRESRSHLDALRKEHGVNGVDMEFSALCAVAGFRGVSLAGIFVVSDELWGADWRPGFGKTSYKKKCEAIIAGLIAYGRKERGTDPS